MHIYRIKVIDVNVCMNLIYLYIVYKKY